MSPIGHFAVSLAAKRVAPKIPLGILLLTTEVPICCSSSSWLWASKAESQVPSLFLGLMVSLCQRFGLG